MATINNRTNLLAADQKMIDGVQKSFTQVTSLPVGSQTSTPADIVKVFQDRITTGNAAVAAEAARTAAVKADRDKRAQTASFVASFKRIVQGMYSQSPDTLATFGLTAPKAIKKTVATKATALAKSKATRVARNTMGKVQKKTVKGTVSSASTGSSTGATPTAGTATSAGTTPTASTTASASTGSTAGKTAT